MTAWLTAIRLAIVWLAAARLMTTWLTAAQAAEHLQVSEPMIRAAVKSGDLQAYAVGKGRNFRLDQDEVDAWMKARSWEPAS